MESTSGALHDVSVHYFDFVAVETELSPSVFILDE